MTKHCICGIFFAAGLLGQTVGAGYAVPAPVSAAPGQILTVFVDNPPTGLLLPTSFTATLRQGSDLPAPILDVRPVYMCPGLVMIAIVGQPACATLAAVTVQIPYELIPLCPPCARPAALPATLLVSSSGNNGSLVLLNPLADQVHILTSCDVMLQPLGTLPQPNGTGLPCPPMVTHADGTLVSPANPAKIGEEVVAWAFGLGQTNPAATTGKPAAGAVPVAQTLLMDFNYQVNALPAKPAARRGIPPLYAGLASGFVGLYQINFVVPPDPIGGTPQCASPGSFGPGANVAQSNLTVSFGGGFSFDGAGICVATRIPID